MGCCIWTGKTVASRSATNALAMSVDTDEDEENPDLMSASTTDWEPVADESSGKPKAEDSVPTDPPTAAAKVSEEPAIEPKVEQEVSKQTLAIAESEEELPDFLDMCCAGDPLELASGKKRRGNANSTVVSPHSFIENSPPPTPSSLIQEFEKKQSGF